MNSSTKIEQPSRLNLVELHLQDSPLEIFTQISRHYDYAYLLESMEGPRKLAQHSFIGFNPAKTIRAKNGVVWIRDNETGEEIEKRVKDPLETVKTTLAERPIDSNGFRLAGGAVGHISYDAIRGWENIPDTATDDLHFPDVEMGIYDDGIVIDHLNDKGFYYYLKQNRFEEIMGLLTKTKDIHHIIVNKPTTNYAKEDFENAVRSAKEYVASGDVFQVVLSKRFEFKFEGDLLAFYQSLRRINPSPYMYYLKADSRRIIGSSPEMLVRVDGREVDTFPIAGTRPHVENPEENKRLAEELLHDPKERAEHVMLVDLARNDIGKVSEFGSVHLPEFMTVHQYSHVQHIVTQVRGRLREDCDGFDALRAVFPAGTVSGAPKIRAMEIIDELEPTRRGPYAGAVGYFSYNGNADFAITIRTLVVEGDRATIQVGAGIVADSVPENEWYETEHKAAALFKALNVSGGGAR